MNISMNNGIHRPLLFVAVASAACGDGTEPPEHADVSGSWTYAATYTVTLGALGTTDCSGSGVRATITHSGSSVSGTARGGEWTCDSPAFALEPFTEEEGDPVVFAALHGVELARVTDGGHVIGLSYNLPLFGGAWGMA